MKSPVFTPFPEFLSTPSQPIKYLVNQLLPSATLCLFHGDPRTKKSYTALEVAIACATGQAAFGLDRFMAPSPSRVLYLSQEDPAHVVRERARAILTDKQLDPPDGLFVGIHQGFNLDYDKSRSYLFDMVRGEAFELVIIDPIRRFTAVADKGPSEVTPITTYFRRFCVDLGTTILILHHNTKPPQIPLNGNGRKDAYNASGGDWFASCECPIGFQTNGDGWIHVIPQEYKLSEDPPSFEVQVIKDGDGGVHIIARDRVENAREYRILAFLLEHPASTENAIASACHIRRADLKSVLAECEARGVITQIKGPNKSRLWLLASDESIQVFPKV